MVEGMVLHDILRLDFGFTAYGTNVYLKIGPGATAVLEGRRKVEIAEVAVAGSSSGGGNGGGGNIDVAVKPGTDNTDKADNAAVRGGNKILNGCGKRSQLAEAEASAAEQRNKKIRQQQGEEEPEVVNLVDDTDNDDDFV
ncbi:hypothetical protein KSW81_003044 [Nannochloris sp. 'desiccata']|nr:hypothetical protein KSW81_003044 [Chlorella desiccata (nom. nud.)]